MASPDFWDDNQQAQIIINETNELKDKYQTFQALLTEQEELDVMLEMQQEEYDIDLQEELIDRYQAFEKQLGQYELTQLLNQPYDHSPAILEIHAGAGGTESQDWADMLLRMYTRWASHHDFSVEYLDYNAGEEAGVKSVTILVKGLNAYGYLKSERGVHRLVRISPFDSAKRRHTSFSSVEVMPELDDSIEVDINSDDLKIDTFRASGAGGQHINKTESAVRITHLPTGIVVSSQAQRSQLKNREQAMSMLKSKLYQLEVEKKEEEAAVLRGEQKEIGWGSQIRSYVFHPYSMVKDHRTLLETGNVQNVMDGEIDPFIDAYLRTKLSE